MSSIGTTRHSFLQIKQIFFSLLNKLKIIFFLENNSSYLMLNLFVWLESINVIPNEPQFKKLMLNLRDLHNSYSHSIHLAINI
jgi:uncharacterized protein YsxB (DUF464 family)